MARWTGDLFYIYIYIYIYGLPEILYSHVYRSVSRVRRGSDDEDAGYWMDGWMDASLVLGGGVRRRTVTKHDGVVNNHVMIKMMMMMTMMMELLLLFPL